MEPSTEEPNDHEAEHPSDEARRRRERALRAFAVAIAVLATLSGLLFPPAASAATTPYASGVGSNPDITKRVSGSDDETYHKEWFNTPFVARMNSLGKLSGRVRFATDTRVRVESTRDLTITPVGDVDGGWRTISVKNTNVGTRMVIESRPSLSLIFDHEPYEYDPNECDMTTFPAMGDSWWKRIPTTGDGFCGAIEVTADDISWILERFGIDLEMPEVFSLFDQSIDPGYIGSRTYAESHQLFEIKVCKIVTQTFGIPIGDHCDVEINAVVHPELVAEPGQHATATYCFDGALNGNQYPCLLPAGEQKDLAWTGQTGYHSARVPCVGDPRALRFKLTDLAWDAKVDAIGLDLSVDFNVHLGANGDGIDLVTLEVPTGIDLIDELDHDNALPLHIDYAAGTSWTNQVGTVRADQTTPIAYVAPTTLEEGVPATVQGIGIDNCQDGLSYRWKLNDEIKPIITSVPTLDRSYATEGQHTGTFTVTDEAGHAATANVVITVANGAPDVTLNAPTAGAANTPISFSAPVVDEGPDTISWTWNWGDGTTSTRTGSSTTDRTDVRTHTYANVGRYNVTVTSNDGAATRSATKEVAVFATGSTFTNHAVIAAAKTTGGLEAGSVLDVNATAAYGTGTKLVGSLSTDFIVSIGGGEIVTVDATTTSLDWALVKSDSVEIQGSATAFGYAGWKLRANYVKNPNGSLKSVTVRLFKPGTTTATNPTYLVTGTY
jgi:hypothetical protein